MSIKEIAEQAFGKNDEECVARFLRKKELDGWNSDIAQYKILQEKYKQWKKEFLLWDSTTFIDGINGWDFDIDSYVELKKEKWLDELKNYREQSWEKYKKYKIFHKEYIQYDECMKKNYPHYDAILEYLMKNTKECDVVRMSSDEDNVIWYFAKDIDSFYVTYISDCM